MSMQQALLEEGVQVVPGSSTFTSNNSFKVPAFNTLTIELWGEGGGGGGFLTIPDGTHGSWTFKAGADGGDTTLSSLSLVAHGGKGGESDGLTGGAGGGASGGTTNVGGGAGGNGTAPKSSASTSGVGGTCNSLAGGAGVSETTFASNPNSKILGGVFGTNEGGGASGDSGSSSTTFWFASCPGGGGGGYCTRAYAYGGVVNYGDVLSFTLSNHGRSNDTSKIKFTWS